MTARTSSRDMVLTMFGFCVDLVVTVKGRLMRRISSRSAPIGDYLL